MGQASARGDLSKMGATAGTLKADVLLSHSSAHQPPQDRKQLRRPFSQRQIRIRSNATFSPGSETCFFCL